MTVKRLNNCLLLHIHKDLTDSLDLTSVAMEFITIMLLLFKNEFYQKKKKKKKKTLHTHIVYYIQLCVNKSEHSFNQ